LGAEARPGAPKTFKATTVPAAPTGLYALLEPRDLAATTVPAEPDDLTAATLPAAPEDLAAAQDLHEWLYDTSSPDETLLYSETGHGGGGFSWAQDEWLASVPTGTSYTFRTNPNDTYSTLNTNRRYEADAVYPFGGKAVYWKTWFSKDQYILCPYLKYYGLRDLEAMKQSPFSTVIYNWDNTYNSQHHAWYFDYVHRNSWRAKRFRYWILSNTAGTYRHVFVVQVLQATPSDPNNLDGWAQKGTPASHITHDYSAFPGAHDLSGKSTLYQGGGPVPMGTQGSLWKDVDAAIPGSVATAFAGTDPHGTRKALFSNT
jgi:hypothetical protein